MARKEQIKHAPVTKNIRTLPMDDLAQEYMADFATYVMLNRAIPDLRDGLKPVQRRILYQTHLSKLYPDAKHMKVIKINGLVLWYHPHGDSSVEKAINTLSQKWVKRIPLIDIQGSVGSIYGDPAASGRYTAGRMAEAAPLLLGGLDENAVKFVDNYDETTQEPDVLPAAFPQAITNSAEGIAFGMKTDLPSFNVIEVMNAAKQIKKGKLGTTSELMRVLKGLDFPGGGIIVGTDGIKNIIETGQGKVLVRGRVEYHNSSTAPMLEITEIPYDVNLRKFIDQVADVADSATALGVADIRDETQDDLEVSLKIVFKRGVKEDTMKKFEALLYKKTHLEKYIHIKNILVHKGAARLFSIREYLTEWLEFRLETLRKIWEFNYNKLKDRAEILEGLLRTYDITDEIIRVAKSSQGKKDMAEKLVAQFKFTQRQAETIAGIPLYQLGKTDFRRLSDEYDENIARTKEYHTWLNDDAEADAQLINDLDRTLKFFKKNDDYKRRTEIVSEQSIEEVPEVSYEDVVEAKDVHVIVKRHLEMSQIGMRAYENQIGEYKEDDIITSELTSTIDYVVGITKSAKIVTRLVDDLANLTLKESATALYKEVTDLKTDDEFIAATPIKVDLSDKRKMIIGSAHGYVKIVPINALLPGIKTKTYVKKTQSASTLKAKGDYLVFGEVLPEDISKYTLSVVLKNKKTNKEIVRKVDMRRWKDKVHGKGGSGLSGYNTKDGELEYVSHSFIEKK